MSEFDAAAFDSFEAEGWATKEALAYDALAGRVTSRLAGPLLDAVAAGAGSRLLDVATGPGYVAAEAAGRGAEAVGLDFSETMLAHARTQVSDVEFVLGDATALPFEDGSFDAVVAAFVLLHLAAPERAIAEAARVLKPGGRAAFTVWDEPSRGRWLGVFFEALTAARGAPPPDLPRGPDFFRLADDAAFTALLEGAAFRDVRVDRIAFDLHLVDADELWDGLLAGSVRVRPMIMGQTDEVRREIRRHYDDLLEAHRAEDGFDVPVSVKLASGAKP